MVKKAVATRKKANLPANIDAEMEAEAAKISETISSSGRFIKVDQETGQYFEIPNLGQAEIPMKAIVVDYVSVNTFYTGKYDSSNIKPPECWAIGKDIKSLAPSDAVENPEAESCNVCPNNEFGSDGGKGKACKNTRLLALLPPDATDDDELMYLRISPTGLKSFDSFVNGVAARTKKPPVAAIVPINIVPSGRGFTVAFGQWEPNPFYKEHYMRKSEAQGVLLQEFTPAGDDAGNTRAAPKRRAPAKRRAKR